MNDERKSTALRAAETSGQWLLNLAFLIGVLVLASYGISEALVHVGWSLGKCEVPSGIPWGQLIGGTLLIAPKMFGREMAGAMWTALASRIKKD